MADDHDSRIKRNAEDIKVLWNAIDEIKKAMTYRLPLWAVGVFGIMCSAMTWMVALLVHK